MLTEEDKVGGRDGRVVPNGFNKKTYCPKSRGGLYSNGNGLLLWSVVGDCDYGVCGDCNAIGVIHTRSKYEGEKSNFLAVTVMVV